MQLKEIDANDPIITELLTKYLNGFGLSDTARPLGKLWWGIYNHDALALVFGYAKRNDGGIELTDFYLVPGRNGLNAVKMAFDFLKSALSSAAVPYVMAPTFFGNKRMRNWITKYLDRPEPDAVVYLFKGGASV